MSRLKPPEGWASLLLLTLMLLTVAWSIEAADWAEGLGLLQGIVLGGILVGFLLARFGVPDLIAHPISLSVGLFWSVFLVGRLLDPASITHRIVLRDADLTWRIRVVELAYRFRAWLEIARGQGVAQDNLVFVLQMAVLIWLVTYISIWLLFRMRHVWGAILPGGFAILLNLYYAPPELYVWMALYLLCALLLIVRSNVFLQEEEWLRERVGYAPDIEFDFLRDGTILAILVVVLAWLVPTTSAAPRLSRIVDRFNEPVYRVQRQFNRLFSALNYKPLPGPAYFGDTLMLTGPVNLGDTPVFDAVTPKGRYWRGVVYDQYTGRGWINTGTDITSLEPGDPRLAAATDFKLRETVTQTIRVLQPGFVLLHALPQPMYVDLPIRVQFTLIPTQTGEGVIPLDVSAIYSRRTLQVGDTYTVVSSISVADEESLRNAGTDYPDWIKQKYLQLPDSLPARVRELAQKITAPYDNPYDKAVAIESYLRKIRYDEKIPGPPPGVDGVDWFLFEERAGYCDYYASAFAVMARSVGIPARIAAGYSLGAYDPEIKAYRQREYDAHSWPEVFFPGYGWVEFEPTAADPRIARPTRPPEAGTDAGDSAGGSQGEGRRFPEELIEEPVPPEGPPLALPWTVRLYRTTWARMVLGLVGGLLLAGLVAWAVWQRGLRGLTVAEGFYARMIRVAKWLGVKRRPSQTPHEYASDLAQAVPHSRPAIWRITEAFVRERFAGIAPSSEERAALVDAWRELRRAFLEGAGVRVVRSLQTFVAEGGVRRLRMRIPRKGS